MADFKECAECASKPGSPLLCESCFQNRELIAKLKAMVADQHEFIKKKHEPCCPECGSTDLEIRVGAFFRVTEGIKDVRGNYIGINAAWSVPITVDVEADGDVYCNACEDMVGTGKKWGYFRGITHCTRCGVTLSDQPGPRLDCGGDCQKCVQEAEQA